MKYNYKLVFNTPLETMRYAIRLFDYISQRNDWLKAYEAMRRKNILYVYTGNYCCIDNYIKSRQHDYNYTITKL